MSCDTDRSDSELIKQAAACDDQAFETLVRRHQHTAWRIAYRYTGNRPDAEEIAQDAFLRVQAVASRYQSKARFITFFYRIVVNLCIDHHRKRKRRPDTEAVLPEQASREPAGDAVYDKKERDDLVQQALDCLPEQQRLIIVLRYFEELPLSGIAEVMNASRKGIERRLARARRQLKKQLIEKKVAPPGE